MQPEEEAEEVGIGDVGCGRTGVLRASEWGIDAETLASRFAARADYVGEVAVVSIILQYERYTERLGLFQAAKHVATMWKEGRLRFEGYTFGDYAAGDLLLSVLRDAEPVSAQERTELYSRIRTPQFLSAWRALLAAIRTCLCSCCASEGPCGPRPEAAVLLAAERLHGVCGRLAGEYEWQLARVMSCQVNEAIAVLESEPVTSGCGYGPSLADALEYVRKDAGEPFRDPYVDVAYARALAAIFEVVAQPTLDDEDGEVRFRVMMEQASLVFGADPCGKHGSGAVDAGRSILAA